MKAELLNEKPALVVSTPCNTLSIPVEIDDDVIHPDDIVSTLKGCDPDRRAQQQWVEDFFSGAVQWQRADDDLTLHSGETTIDLVVD
jgi:heat shock protein HslJ